jgi:RimJ/RimL family protein N-acetyltransferase
VAETRLPELLVTDRLLLRRWRLADLDALAELFALPEVWEFPFGRGLTRSESEKWLGRVLEGWEDNGYDMYALELAGTDRLIGFTGLRLAKWFSEIDGEVEIGWRLHPDSWGNGYATEAALASLRVGFDELGAERIVAVVEPANAASLRLAERLGMRVVREALEPRLGKLLEVCVLERGRSGELAAGGPGSASSLGGAPVLPRDDVVASPE